MFEIHEINAIAELADFRPAWQALLAESAGASFFHSLEWLECYWKHFGAGQRLRAMVVAEDGKPIGILPLVVREESTRVGRVRVLTYPLHDWATFYGPIGSRPAETLAQGLRHVRNTPRDWDLLDLRWIGGDRESVLYTPTTMAEAGLRACQQKWDQTSIIEFGDKWQEYWQGRESKFRKNIDRLQKRVAEEGQLELVRFRTEPEKNDDPRWDLFDLCVSLAERSWQGTGGDKTNLCHGEVGSYFRDAHAAAAKLGAVDLCLLYFEGQPAAFAYNYMWNGAVYGLRKGFDPHFARLRPGLVLQKLMLEDGHRRGDGLYDLGTGGHRGKSAWRTAASTSYRFTHFPATVLRAQLLWVNRWLRRQIRGERDIACPQLV